VVRFEKPALSLDQQILLLRSRHLLIDSEVVAKQSLATLGYYR